MVSVITTVALVVTIGSVGFFVCLLPPMTHGLSSMFARDDLSPFNREQLVRVADATRDFSFGTHSRLALYQTIYDIDKEYLSSVQELGKEIPTAFPRVEAVENTDDVGQLEAAFANASEAYCYSANSVSHLDDCYSVACQAVPVLVVLAIIALVGLVVMGGVWKTRQAPVVLMVAGAAVVLAFVMLGAWAALDFSGLFTAFHQLFFSQGNWQFPYDSLMICSLPTEFWMGMGAVWLLTSSVVSLLLIVAGIMAGRRMRA